MTSSHSHNAARIIVSTEQNVIAAINGHSGRIGETSAQLMCLSGGIVIKS